MNEILKKRVEEAGQAGSLHYNPETSAYSHGKQVGYLRGFNAGAEYALSHQWISIDEALPDCKINVIGRCRDGRIYPFEPYRVTYYWTCEIYTYSPVPITLPKGFIKNLIGRDLTWEDNPVELKEE